MKNIICILLLIFFVKNIHCQDNLKNAETNNRKIQIGFIFSPAVSYRTHRVIGNDDIAEFLKNTRKGYEIPNFGYDLGLNINYKIKSFISIGTGLLYSNKGYKTKWREINNSITDPPVSNYKLKNSYDFHYFSVPINVAFIAGHKKVRFISSIGITTEFLIKYKSTAFIDYGTQKIESIVNNDSRYFRKVNLSPSVSLGIDYKINEKMHIIVQPFIKFGVIKIADTNLAEYLWNSGISLSYCMNIKSNKKR